MTDLNEAISGLIKQGCKRVTFDTTEQGQPVVLVEQILQTSGGSGQSKMLHSCMGHDHETALRKVQAAVSLCSNLQGKLVNLDTNIIN